jgi:molybdopterin adenylyltransferase
MIRVAVLTVSDSAAAGTREDRSGPALEERVLGLGWKMARKKLVRDEVYEISAGVSDLAHSGEVDVILSTGGTGVALRDVTPEAVRAVAPREIPGFGEVMRAEGRKSTAFAALSRSGAYTLGVVLIVTLPGSPLGAIESLNAVADLIPHAISLLHGHTAHEAKPEA